MNKNSSNLSQSTENSMPQMRSTTWDSRLSATTSISLRVMITKKKVMLVSINTWTGPMMSSIVWTELFSQHQSKIKIFPHLKQANLILKMTEVIQLCNNNITLLINMLNRLEQWLLIYQLQTCQHQLIGCKLSYNIVQMPKFSWDNKESADHAGLMELLLLWNSITGKKVVISSSSLSNRCLIVMLEDSTTTVWEDKVCMHFNTLQLYQLLQSICIHTFMNIPRSIKTMLKLARTWQAWVVVLRLLHTSILSKAVTLGNWELLYTKDQFPLEWLLTLKCSDSMTEDHPSSLTHVAPCKTIKSLELVMVKRKIIMVMFLMNMLSSRTLTVPTGELWATERFLWINNTTEKLFVEFLTAAMSSLRPLQSLKCHEYQFQNELQIKNIDLKTY